MALHDHQRAVQGRKPPADVQGAQISEVCLARKFHAWAPFWLSWVLPALTEPRAITRPLRGAWKPLDRKSLHDTGTCCLRGSWTLHVSWESPGELVQLWILIP